MAKGKDNSQQSQAESSVKRLIKRLKRKDKNKSPTVEPKKPVEAPEPVETPAAPVAVSQASRRRRRRREEEFPEAIEPVRIYPRDSWSTLPIWSKAAMAVTEEFLARYAEMGFEGIKEEFKKEIEGYKSPDYADTLWKANPTKNRDKDQMTCLDSTRVEFSSDKKRYINASWLYDTQLVAQKYILTQEPIVPLAKGDASTIDDFWEMVHSENCAHVIKFNQTPVREDRGKGIYSETMGNKFRPNKYAKPVDLADFILQLQEYPKSHALATHIALVHVSPKRRGGEDRDVIVFEADENDWTVPGVRRVLHTIAQIKKNKERPIVLMDDFMGTSRAAIFVAIDVLGNLLWTAQKDVTLVSIVKWIRRCRNGAIRDAEEYLAIAKILIRILGSVRNLKRTEKFAAMLKGLIEEDNRKREEVAANRWKQYEIAQAARAGESAHNN